jgi:hypothetical protein
MSDVVVTVPMRLQRRELQRRGGAVTLDEPIRGFRGWRYRWWSLESERPFPGWREP